MKSQQTIYQSKRLQGTPSTRVVVQPNLPSKTSYKYPSGRGDVLNYFGDTVQRPKQSALGGGPNFGLKGYNYGNNVESQQYISGAFPEGDANFGLEGTNINNNVKSQLKFEQEQQQGIGGNNGKYGHVYQPTSLVYDYPKSGRSNFGRQGFNFDTNVASQQIIDDDITEGANFRLEGAKVKNNVKSQLELFLNKGNQGVGSNRGRYGQEYRPAHIYNYPPISDTVYSIDNHEPVRSMRQRQQGSANFGLKGFNFGNDVESQQVIEGPIIEGNYNFGLEGTNLNNHVKSQLALNGYPGTKNTRTYQQGYPSNVVRPTASYNFRPSYGYADDVREPALINGPNFGLKGLNFGNNVDAQQHIDGSLPNGNVNFGLEGTNLNNIVKSQLHLNNVGNQRTAGNNWDASRRDDSPVLVEPSYKLPELSRYIYKPESFGSGANVHYGTPSGFVSSPNFGLKGFNFGNNVDSQQFINGQIPNGNVNFGLEGTNINNHLKSQLDIHQPSRGISYQPTYQEITPAYTSKYPSERVNYYKFPSRGNVDKLTGVNFGLKGYNFENNVESQQYMDGTFPEGNANFGLEGVNMGNQVKSQQVIHGVNGQRHENLENPFQYQDVFGIKHDHLRKHIPAGSYEFTRTDIVTPRPIGINIDNNLMGQHIFGPGKYVYGRSSQLGSKQHQDEGDFAETGDVNFGLEGLNIGNDIKEQVVMSQGSQRNFGKADKSNFAHVNMIMEGPNPANNKINSQQVFAGFPHHKAHDFLGNVNFGLSGLNMNNDVKSQQYISMLPQKYDDIFPVTTVSYFDDGFGNPKMHRTHQLLQDRPDVVKMEQFVF